MRAITSERVLLRPWEEDDAHFLFDLDSRWETVRYLGPHASPMTSLEQARASILRRRALDHRIHGIWAITAREDGQLLGNLLLKPVPLSSGADREAPVEIGWHLHPDAQGLGYATEAAAAAMKDAANSGLASIIAVTDPRNVGSQRVCVRLGFTPRGTTAEFYDHINLLFEKNLTHDS